MTARLLVSALFLSAVAALSACDFAGSDGTSGRWVGTANFEVDTLLADHNVRITAAYETEFTFRLTDDEGLITGQLTARTTGHRVTHEAGQPADTLYFQDEAPLVHEVFGTYLDPTLEVDVPNGPYEENLWTFEVTGRRARIDRTLVHLHQIPLANDEPFEFDILSTDTFEMSRVADAE